MRLASLVTLFIFTTNLISQTSSSLIVRDGKALDIVRLTLAASGFATTKVPADLTETGTITYNWANKNVEGLVKIVDIGTTDIRLDAALSSGTYRWFESDGRGKKEAGSGRVENIPYHCGVSQAALTFPVSRLAKALNDTDYELKYLGSVDDQNGTQYRISMKYMAGQNPAEQVASALNSAEFLISSKTYLISQLKDFARSESDMFNSVPRILTYSDYHAQDGIELPFSIEEDVNGAHTWKLQVDSAQINTGVSRDSIGF